MTQTVTVEGSIRPCQDLPRGQRKTVVLTDTTKRRIKLGYYDVIEYHDAPEDSPVDGPSDHEDQASDDEHGDVTDPAPAAEPKVTQSTADWKAWFDAQEPPIPYPVDVTRKQLMHAWTTIKQAREQAG